MTAQQAFEARVEDTIKSMRPYLAKVAEGDEDLIQEGAIGIWEAMKRSKPEAGDGLLQAARPSGTSETLARGVGKSLDIPKWHERKTPASTWFVSMHHRKAMRRASSPRRSWPTGQGLPMDEYVIDKVDFERFLATLTMREAGYLFLKLVWEAFGPRGVHTYGTFPDYLASSR